MLYTCSPRQTKKFICRALGANIVPYIQGQPGIGKSQIVHSIAEENKLEFIDLRLSMCDPTDLMGIPHIKDSSATWVPFNAFPNEYTPIPKNKNGWILMLDELSSCNKSIQAAAYKLILDHMVGQKKLHPNCYIIAAGNRIEDKAVANKLSTALISRMLIINMEVNYEDWLKDVALKRNFDHRIVGFLDMYPDKLNTFDPENELESFCSPRTWEFVNNLIKDKEVTDEDLSLFAGLIDPGVGAEFIQFTKVYKKIVPYKDIVKDYKKSLEKLNQDDIELMYATASSIMACIKKEDLSVIFKFVDELPQSFKLLIAKGIFHQHQEFLLEDSAREFISSIAEYLN